MTDVFISYAREDRETAERLAAALGALGWSVWWDRDIVAGQTFDETIERALESAKSVVVLWSVHSIGSEWVRNEASAAAERGVLVPALIAQVKPPLEFRRKQSADLTDWRGEPSHSGFDALCEGVARAIGGASPAAPPTTPAAPVRPAPAAPAAPALPEADATGSKRRPILAIVAVVIAGVALGVYLVERRPKPGPPQLDRVERTRIEPSGKPDASRIALAGLADLAAGRYDGDVISDSRGGSRSDVVVIVSKVDRNTVRVASEYSRLGTVEIALTRDGNQLLNAGGDTPFIVDLSRNPPTLSFDPRGEVAYRGTKRQ